MKNLSYENKWCLAGGLVTLLICVTAVMIAKGRKAVNVEVDNLDVENFEEGNE